jgi:hypothetical protein
MVKAQTHSDRSEAMDDDFQVVITPALKPPFEAWVASRGGKLVELPSIEKQTWADDLPTYVVTPL